MRPVEDVVNLSEDGEIAFDEFSAKSTISSDLLEEMNNLRLSYKEKLLSSGSFISVKRDNIYDIDIYLC